MITIDELKTQLGEYETAVKDLGEALAITASEKRVAELEHKMSQPGFYDDAEASQKVFAEVSDLKGKLERYGKLTRLYDDADTMLLLCEEENDPEMIPEAEESVHKVAEAIDELQMITLLSGEYDKNNAILTFHAGTGGTEAQDWADMLSQAVLAFDGHHLVGRGGQALGGCLLGGAEAVVGPFTGQAGTAAFFLPQPGRLAVHGYVHQKMGHAVDGPDAGRGGGQGGNGKLGCFFHGMGSSYFIILGYCGKNYLPF